MRKTYFFAENKRVERCWLLFRIDGDILKELVRHKNTKAMNRLSDRDVFIVIDVISCFPFDQLARVSRFV